MHIVDIPLIFEAIHFWMEATVIHHDNSDRI